MATVPTQHSSGGANNRSPKPSEEAIGPLLARANLLRIRGQWAEAVAACTEALRLVPNSASACSLLGDIYESQNRLDDALQWFGMAVEFDPQNVSDRAKLERVAHAQRRATQREERAAEQRARRSTNGTAPAIVRGDNATGTGGRTSSGTVVAAASEAGHRTLQWFDRLFPPGRWESAARLILLLCVAMALVLLFATGFVYLSSRDDAADTGTTVPGDDPLAPPAVRSVVVPAPAAPPLTSPSLSGNDAQSAPPIAAAGPQTPAGRAAGTSTPAAPGQNPAPANGGGGSDTALLGALRRALGTERGAAQIAGADMDARGDQISVSFALPALAGETAAAGRERILRQAAHAARVIGEQRPSVNRVLVHVSLNGSDSQSARTPAAIAPAATFAFSGETAPPAARALNVETAPEPELRALFLNAVWGGGLAP